MVKKKTSGTVTAKSAKIASRDYVQTLAALKQEIQEAQMRASLAVNRELLKLYWAIGRVIAEKQAQGGWGSKIIEKLAEDLQNEFPGIAGFSRANIFRMRAFYAAYEIVAAPPRQLESLPLFGIPWWHNVILMTKLKNVEQRLWYAQKSLEYGWSGSMLEMWIKSDLFHREGKSVNNFSMTLPSPHSDMAQQALKDPYLFDFLTLQHDHLEKDLEHGLVGHIQNFLLELGEGFAFIARQKHIVVDGVDYYIDLLFYHLKLRCYVVVELKSTSFKPEYAGKINFYLSAVDDLLKHPDDQPTIGLILCKSKHNFTVEYALRRSASPIGVASYETKILEKLPREFKGSLPTVQDLEAEFEKIEGMAEIKHLKRNAVAGKKPTKKVVRKKA